MRKWQYNPPSAYPEMTKWILKNMLPRLRKRHQNKLEFYYVFVLSSVWSYYRVFDLSYKTNGTKNSFINFQCTLININNNKNVY